MTKKQKKSPAFQFYPSDFMGSPRVRAMTLAEIGLYALGLCADWELDGVTRDELKDLALSQRATPEEFAACFTKVRGCFREKSGRLFNGRLDEERAKQRAWRRKCSRGGKLSAAKRGKGSSRVVEVKGNTPSPTPSPTPVTTNNKKSAPASRTPARESWLLPVSRSYETQKGAGTFPWGKAGRLLKPLRAAGHEGEEIAARLDRYGRWLDDKKFFSLARFAETFGDYADDVPAHLKALAGYPDIVDTFGCFTEYGERVTRPQGFPPMKVA